MNNRNVILIGYSGHAYVAAEIFLLMKYKVVGYIDKIENTNNPFGLEYLGNDETFYTKKINGKKLFTAIGDNALRNKLSEKYAAQGFEFTNAIHPSAILSKNITISTNILIGAQCVIQSGSVIQEGVICNTGSIIEHECTLKKYAHIAPSSTLCGNVTIGEKSLIGAGTIVIPNTVIGNNVIVGAGSVIIKNIDDNKKVAGNPARTI
ncbi:MAG: acetyltransferase [Bacteroidetes bacterium]|nr:acetyltransferase [Bacteroidota bacterium]